MSQIRHSEVGFTLLELLAVVVSVGILSTIAVFLMADK